MNDDSHMRCEAMMHLEVADDLIWTPECLKEASARITAALYLIQAMGAGPRPDNYENILSAAREYDAKAEFFDVVRRAKSR